MAKITSSSNRSKRKRTKNPTSSKTRPQRSRVSSNAKDKMTVSGQKVQRGGPRGAQGPRTAPVQGPYQKPKLGLIGSTAKGGSKTPPPSLRSSLKAGAKTAAKVAGLARSGPVRAAGTLVAGAIAGAMKRSRKQTKTSNENKGAAYKAQQKKLPKVKMPEGPKKDTSAQSFDKAFAKARKEGKKEFSWRGKQYHTRLKK